MIGSTSIKLIRTSARRAGCFVLYLTSFPPELSIHSIRAAQWETVQLSKPMFAALALRGGLSPLLAGVTHRSRHMPTLLLRAAERRARARRTSRGQPRHAVGLDGLSWNWWS